MSEQVFTPKLNVPFKYKRERWVVRMVDGKMMLIPLGTVAA